MAFYKPYFSHPHHHSFECKDSLMVNINKNLIIRSDEILKLCKILKFNSIIDMGCNMGGILYYLNQYSSFAELIGVEGDPRFYNEANKINEFLNTKIKFYNKNFFRYKISASEGKKDCLILQNIYHYLYDKSGNHDEIFSKMSSLTNNIIWYNPVDNQDPVISNHANSNNSCDWEKFTIENICISAIKNDFYLPISLDFNINGMGESRQHLLFPSRKKKESNKITITNYEMINIFKLTEYKNHEYYKEIHKIYYDEKYFYKIYSDKYQYLADKIYRLFQINALDKNIVNEIFFIQKNNKIIGYKQKKMLNYDKIIKKFPSNKVNDEIYSLYYLLFSNSLKFNFLPIDFTTHNIKFEINDSGDLNAYLIDLESFIVKEEQIYIENKRNYSIYKNITDFQNIPTNIKLFFKFFPENFLNLKVDTLLKEIIFKNENFFIKKDLGQVEKIFKKIS